MACQRIFFPFVAASKLSPPVKIYFYFFWWIYVKEEVGDELLSLPTLILYYADHINSQGDWLTEPVL